MRLPPLGPLRAFDAVARLGSVRQAGKELGVDHSVVSRQIRQLQLYVGIHLFTSSRQGMALTPAGQAYADLVTPALRTIAVETERLRTTQAETPLVIWCVPGLALHWLTSRLASLRRRFPKWSIVLRPTEQIANFAQDEADVDIRYGTAPDVAGTRSLLLARPRMYPVASADWVARNRVGSVDDLLRAHLLHEEDHDQWRTWLRACGADPAALPNGQRLWHSHIAIEAARSGQGVALANDFLVDADKRAGTLHELLMTDVVLGGYYMTARADRWAERRIAAFREWLLREVQT